MKSLNSSWCSCSLSCVAEDLSCISTEDRKRPPGRPRMNWLTPTSSHKLKLTYAVNTALSRPYSQEAVGLRMALRTPGDGHSIGG